MVFPATQGSVVCGEELRVEGLDVAYYCHPDEFWSRFRKRMSEVDGGKRH